MSDDLRGVVVCHGRLAGALVEAAEQISGVTGALAAVSNTGCDRGALEELFAVLNRLRATNTAKVVTGVNLAMLVDFVFHRSLALDEAAARAAIAGGKAIRVP